MTDLTPQQAQALRMLVDAVLAAVEAGGDLGAPSGVIYMGLMKSGATLSQYQSLMDALVRMGKIRRSGDLYFTVKP